MKKPLLMILTCAVVLVACSRETDNSSATAENTAVDASAAPAAALPRTASVEGARVFFVSPADGDTVSNPVRVVFGIEGMSVVPAGDDSLHSGHHHLLIDTGLPDPSLPIPKDNRHVHFGDGSTEAEITLEPGEHSLQMLLGDHLHIPHDPPLTSERITVYVQ
jgi:hypothetical protein